MAKSWFMIDFDQVEVDHTLKAGMPSVPSLLLVSAEWKELVHDDSPGQMLVGLREERAKPRRSDDKIATQRPVS